MEPLAQMIRQDTYISGVPIGTQEHQTGLFADDVNLAVTNPDKSLPHIQCILHTFSAVSY